MILRGIYVDGFILHDESVYEDLDEDERDAMRKESEKLGHFLPELDHREVCYGNLQAGFERKSCQNHMLIFYLMVHCFQINFLNHVCV